MQKQPVMDKARSPRSNIKSLVSCSAESLERSGESILVPNSLLEEYENMRLRTIIAQDKDECSHREEGFSLFSAKPVNRRNNVLRPILPRPSEPMLQHERPVVDVPFKSLPCQAHFIRGNCMMRDNCFFYHSVHNAAIYLGNVEPTHPIVLNYRIQKLAHERGQGHFVSNVNEKMEALNVELLRANRTKQAILQQNSELQQNFMNATQTLQDTTQKVQDLEAENCALRGLIKSMQMRLRTDEDETLATSCRNLPKIQVPRLGKPRRKGRGRGRC